MPRGLLVRHVIAFWLAIACFVGSTFYTESISRAIDQDAVSIASNATPSIQELSEVRAQLHRLVVGLRRYAALPSDEEREREVTLARTRMEEAFERYLQLSTYEGEHELWAELHHNLMQLERAVEAVLGDIDKGNVNPWTRLDGQLRAATDNAADVLGRMIQFNAQHGRRLALQIEQRRHRARRVAIALNALSAMFTIMAAYLSLRALRDHHRVAAERNHLMQRRADELEQFAGRVAHDILGPLSATRIALGYASERAADETSRRMLERGNNSVGRVATIVDGLLRFARAGAQPESGVATQVEPVVNAVRAAIEPEAGQHETTLVLHPVPECAVIGNAGVLTSLIENLVRNALKYMGDRPLRRIDVRVQARAASVRVEVADTGPGIAPGMLDRIFDPHVRGVSGGAPGIGLGLATVKRITEAHGGRCGVQSTLGVGSVFWFELPRATLQALPTPPISVAHT